MRSRVLEEESGHVRILSLNRPQKLNALSFAMVDRLVKKFRSYEKDPKAKLVILKPYMHGLCLCSHGLLATELAWRAEALLTLLPSSLSTTALIVARRR
ncbi:hypothetical protein ACLOJK_033999 [Asimina triloba]